jgi:glycosyltransferase involved in cell wall biosynthesis
VDNASTDETSAFAADEWARLGSKVPFSIVAEAQPGLTHARRRGLEAARFDIIAFVDDDNWLAPEWVATVQEIMESHPSIGILGTPNIEAVFESPPPVWAPLMLGSLACGSAQFSGLTFLKRGGIVSGAGMVLRRAAWQQLASCYGALQMRGRVGKETSSGEDIEICYVIGLLGWDLAQHGGLRMRHWLPIGRFSEYYLVNLIGSIAVASNGLDPLRRLASGQFRSIGQFGVVGMYVRQLFAGVIRATLQGAKALRAANTPEGPAHRIFLSGSVRQCWHLITCATSYFQCASRVLKFYHAERRDHPHAYKNQKPTQ